MGDGRVFVANARSQVASAILDADESTTFEVSFQSAVSHKCQGQIRLSVVDNQYDDCVIHLVAESYLQDVTIDNVTSACDVTDDLDDVTTADDNVPGLYCVLCTTHVLMHTLQFSQFGSISSIVLRGKVSERPA